MRVDFAVFVHVISLSNKCEAFNPDPSGITCRQRFPSVFPLRRPARGTGDQCSRRDVAEVRTTDFLYLLLGGRGRHCRRDSTHDTSDISRRGKMRRDRAITDLGHLR